MGIHQSPGYVCVFVLCVQKLIELFGCRGGKLMTTRISFGGSQTFIFYRFLIAEQVMVASAICPFDNWVNQSLQKCFISIPFIISRRFLQSGSCCCLDPL